LSEDAGNRHIYRRVGIISFFTLLSRILGAVRDLVLIHVFGAGIAHDAYVVAQTIPNALRRLTAEGSMTLAFVPIYSELREKLGQQQARLFARRALGLVLSATVALSVVGIFASDYVVYAFASGYGDNSEKYHLTVILTRIMFPYLILVSVFAWAMGVLNAEGRFASPAAAPILLNVGLIIGALALTYFFDPPIVAVAVGMLIGGVLQVILQWPSLRAISQSIVPLGFFRDKGIRQLLRLLTPSLFGVAVYEVNIIVLRTIASTYPDGQMTYYYISSRLTELVIGLFAFAFAAASFPEMSKQSAKAQWQKMFETLRFAISGAMFVIVPAALGLFVVAEPIVKMLYLHGEFDVADADTTVNVLRAFAISIPAMTMTRLLLPAYYSLKDARTPVAIFFLTVLVTAAAGFSFGHYYQVVGLGIGLSCGMWCQALLLYILLKRKGQLRSRVLAYGELAKYTLVAAVAVSAAYTVSRLGQWNLGAAARVNWLAFTGLLSLAVLLYFTILYIIHDVHARRLSRMLLSRRRP